MLELLARVPGARILLPATEEEAAGRQRVAEFRQQLYHSYGKDLLTDKGKK